jgi:hypothetical protein
MRIARSIPNRCYLDGAQRRANVRTMAHDQHPSSPCLAALLLAWSDAEAAAKQADLGRPQRLQAERMATAAMREYLRVKALPIVFPFVVVDPDCCK